MAERRTPRRQKTARGHRHRADRESCRGETGVGQRDRNRVQAQREKNVDDAETEERDVSEPRHAPPQRRVAAHPILPMKKEAGACARDRTGNHHCPADKQVEPDRFDHGMDDYPLAPPFRFLNSCGPVILSRRSRGAAQDGRRTPQCLPLERPPPNRVTRNGVLRPSCAAIALRRLRMTAPDAIRSRRSCGS